ncbi:uncharacterized protein Z518_10999 [Rhinocladiella mackenziei CBS 650.93]|uniref:C2H2-type domain-containing protein n=1 Tax=Rhinocladiella mackenziei CBS 650.93 TaxID=1442369 RepID=A0A0D2FDB1_9EURO|nr:uncharacterized protein Z518_10999 [Rhinocladiella mackenziei CBS 650.93]KIX00072.1 hypothetical protein Z518_10999 [Rhinocladiella mackenziei CBS 650.93]
MTHIENDQCTVIRLTDFQMQRAERQLQKDAWMAQEDPLNINPSTRKSPTASDLDSGSSVLSSNPVHNTATALKNTFEGTISTTSHEKSSPLQSFRDTYTAVDTPKIKNSELGMRSPNKVMDFDQTMRRLDRHPFPQDSRSVLPAEGVKNPDKVQPWLDNMHPTARPPPDNTSMVASMYDKNAPSSAVSENIPPSVRARDPDPAAPHKHVINIPAHSAISPRSQLDIQKFWDGMQQKYICPGMSCNRGFKSIRGFQEHLLSSAHVGGTVVCPSCLKRFGSTAAWVAHCESGSRRCDIRNSSNFNHVMREITGGVLGTQGFLEDGTVQYVAQKIEDWNAEPANEGW